MTAPSPHPVLGDLDDSSPAFFPLSFLSPRAPVAASADPEKVCVLMDSIKEKGLHEPIDVLEVEGVYYSFSGCHRFEAHQRLGRPTILCRVIKANRASLRFHMM